ncbi:rho guanine nucleotide exchange factor 40-like [Protobothrops mucrosquamatus]|uniref:rho guanine nucleotide exchange factor 40-like n=1 Tax=Protobothrops mucrosquamatus TaxID=103944 RepID=UPI0010FB0454|nr:rho guanine nucleotide exchange factor 40-like [Protobothrops mucrosquamatus]
MSAEVVAYPEMRLGPPIPIRLREAVHSSRLKHGWILEPEPVEECVQSTLAALYPPFEATAPTLLSQVFEVLEQMYQHDALRYTLDFLVPAKHILARIQSEACAQYSGFVFCHEGWPLCLHEKVLVQLGSLPWQRLCPGDFYLQVVPHRECAPRLVLKCLSLEGRGVQELPVSPDSYRFLFTIEWLNGINKERRVGRLERCLLAAGEKVLSLPWAELVYPQFVHTDGFIVGQHCPTGLTPEVLGARSPGDGRHSGGENRESEGEYVHLLEVSPTLHQAPRIPQPCSAQIQTMPARKGYSKNRSRRHRAWLHHNDDVAEDTVLGKEDLLDSIHRDPTPPKEDSKESHSPALATPKCTTKGNRRKKKDAGRGAGATKPEDSTGKCSIGDNEGSSGEGSMEGPKLNTEEPNAKPKTSEPRTGTEEMPEALQSGISYIFLLFLSTPGGIDKAGHSLLTIVPQPLQDELPPGQEDLVNTLRYMHSLLSVSCLQELSTQITLHQETMQKLLSEPRLLELQCRGGSLLAQLPLLGPCSTQAVDATRIYQEVDEALHGLVQLSNRCLEVLQQEKKNIQVKQEGKTCLQSANNLALRALSDPGRPSVHIRGLEVSSRELADRSCSPREHVLLGRSRTHVAEAPWGATPRMERRRCLGVQQQLLVELLECEREYVGALTQPLSLSQEPRGQAWTAELRCLGSALRTTRDRLLAFHSNCLLSELEGCMNHLSRAGSCFLCHKEELQLYATYAKDHDKFQAALALLRSTGKKGLMEPREDGQIAYTLQVPLEQLERYRRFLGELLHECELEQGPDRQALQEAQQLLEAQEQRGRDLLATEQIRGCEMKLSEQGPLLQCSELILLSGRRKCQRHVFLFEQLLLFTKCKGAEGSYVCKQALQTASMGLTESVGSTGLRFELWFGRGPARQAYTLQAASAEVKHQWTNIIAQLLWRQALGMEPASETPFSRKPWTEFNKRTFFYAHIEKAIKITEKPHSINLKDEKALGYENDCVVKYQLVMPILACAFSQGAAKQSQSV